MIMSIKTELKQKDYLPILKNSCKEKPPRSRFQTLVVHRLYEIIQFYFVLRTILVVFITSAIERSSDALQSESNLSISITETCELLFKFP